MKKYVIIFAVLIILFFLGGCVSWVNVSEKEHTVKTVGMVSPNYDAIGRLRISESRARINDAYADDLKKRTTTGTTLAAGAGNSRMNYPVQVTIENCFDRTITIVDGEFRNTVLRVGEQAEYKMILPGPISFVVGFINDSGRWTETRLDRIVEPLGDNVLTVNHPNTKRARYYR